MIKEIIEPKLNKLPGIKQKKKIKSSVDAPVVSKEKRKDTEQKPKVQKKKTVNQKKNSNIAEDKAEKKISLKNKSGKSETENIAVAAKPAAKKPAQRKKADQSRLRVISLGGLNEIGKNMTVIEYENDIIAIDCGMAFPDDDMLGIDVVIPDFSYLEKNAEKFKGVIITHAHEDHIGAISYLLKKFNVPIYATKLTIGFIKNRLKEFDLNGDLREIVPGSKFKLGCFKIEAVHTTHSVADALAFAIDTPVGMIFHTGDFKIDYTPVNGEPPDLTRMAELGKDGVLLLMADSTNALKSGFTPSERYVTKTLRQIFTDTPHRIIIATFSSNVDRVETIFNLAIETGRKVAVSGRSMENMVALAKELGYLNIPANTLISINEIKNYDDREIIIITTGSQGEPMSALARMASNEHKQVKIKKNDVIILSATPVPGNEKTVSNVINLIMSKGATVITKDKAQTHVSGHGCSEELKLIHTLIKPKFFMPVHGEAQHLIEHCELAKSLGMKDTHVFKMENGEVLELSKTKGEILKDKIENGAVFVDGLGVGDVGSVVVNERKALSESGLVVVSVCFDGESGKIIEGPNLYTKGFVYVKEYGEILDKAKIRLQDILVSAEYENRSIEESEAMIVKGLRKFLYENTNRNPVIVPVFTVI